MNAEKVAREIVEAFGQHNLCKCNNCLAVLTKALTSYADEKVEEGIRIVSRYWRFDEQQQPMASWHEKQDCTELLRKLKSGGK